MKNKALILSLTLLLAAVFGIWSMKPVEAERLAARPESHAAAALTEDEIMAVCRHQNVLPERLRERLSEAEIHYLLTFEQGVRAAGQDWRPLESIESLNRYAFLVERLQRTTDAFEPGTVRRVYRSYGISLMGVPDRDVARMATMSAKQLVQVVTEHQWP